jgi:hypothetical protein
VIENAIKVWRPVIRLLCRGECKTTCTQLLPNMLPYKHYCAEEVQEALQAQADGTPTCQLETSADESTLRRWRSEFRAVLTTLSGTMESIAATLRGTALPLLRLAGTPLARLREAVLALEKLPAGWTYLARAYFWHHTHLVCLGCPADHPLR